MSFTWKHLVRETGLSQPEIRRIWQVVLGAKENEEPDFVNAVFIHAWAWLVAFARLDHSQADILLATVYRSAKDDLDKVLTTVLDTDEPDIKKIPGLWLTVLNRKYASWGRHEDWVDIESGNPVQIASDELCITSSRLGLTSILAKLWRQHGREPCEAKST